MENNIDMKRKLIITGSIIIVLAICDVLSCVNFYGNEWKWDTGPRITDFIDFGSDYYYSYKTHSILYKEQTQGYLIFSFGNHALLYITKGKDEANPRGLSIYIKL